MGLRTGVTFLENSLVTQTESLTSTHSICRASPEETHTHVLIAEFYLAS